MRHPFCSDCGRRKPTHAEDCIRVARKTIETLYDELQEAYARQTVQIETLEQQLKSLRRKGTPEYVAELRSEIARLNALLDTRAAQNASPRAVGAEAERQREARDEFIRSRERP